MFVVPAVIALAGACSAAPPAEAPEAHERPRVFVAAVLYDVPAEQKAPLISGDPAASLGELALAAGASHVVSPHMLVADGAVVRMPSAEPPTSTDDALEAAFATYRLDLTPHVLDPGRVQLEVDLELAGKKATATIVVVDKQRIVLAPEVVVEGRRFVLVVQPNIVRSDADLRAIHDDLAARRDARTRGR